MSETELYFSRMNYWYDNDWQVFLIIVLIYIIFCIWLCHPWDSILEFIARKIKKISNKKGRNKK